MRIFVPVEDAPFDARVGALVPYRCGLDCEHALRARAGDTDVEAPSWWWLEPSAPSAGEAALPALQRR
ncbi:hypothetical protein [Dokdonella sp.]|uniref:hypothetical protein n=1 Tax=Dokdonella sp. TaxID=2291710 RepID=UPI0025B9C5E4|nr:hypothetical protein [Dokdonella sp.]MBX3691861.1 hypothetical protein [Dokdonella sp.]MCW5568369.1 hypothetical protein [Dokdonella sp.]